MKWIRWVLLKIQSGHDSVHRRTDGQGDTSIPPYQLRWSGGYNKSMDFRMMHAVIKVRNFCHGQELWKLARSCKQLQLLCPPDPWNLPGTAPGELCNPLIKTVPSKCSFIRNKGPVNICNNNELKSNLYVGPVNIFLILDTVHAHAIWGVNPVIVLQWPCNFFTKLKHLNLNMDLNMLRHHHKKQNC